MAHFSVAIIKDVSVTIIKACAHGSCISNYFFPSPNCHTSLCMLCCRLFSDVIIEIVLRFSKNLNLYLNLIALGGIVTLMYCTFRSAFHKLQIKKCIHQFSFLYKFLTAISILHQHKIANLSLRLFIGNKTNCIQERVQNFACIGYRRCSFELGNVPSCV